MNNCEYRVSVKALIKNSENELLLVEEKEGNGFELPGGGVENGETINEALNRELLEELNVKPLEIANNPIFVWIINGEVIWLIYEVELEKNTDITPSNTHISNAGYYDIEELLNKEQNGLGYCCRINIEDLQKYIRIN